MRMPRKRGAIVPKLKRFMVSSERKLGFMRVRIGCPMRQAFSSPTMASIGQNFCIM